ncbi:MAG: bifunctional glutamate N-acetyltransferase/amino-acid acetyltransferase ArgJ [Candidatus Omnitrophota bacterium]
MRVVSGGVCSPRGFLASGLRCGIKRKRPDVALIYSLRPAVACGVCTVNSFKAAPVQLSRRHLRGGQARAVIVNSGNANCFTGAYGMAYAQRMARAVAGRLSLKEQEVLVASTGIIGKVLPIVRIERAVPELVSMLSRKGGTSAAEAIMTTDKILKHLSVRFRWGGTDIKIGAMAKGAGMIAPKMSTMLCFITTDALITRPALKAALKDAVETSFNNITVDGCMSTNDSVFILANGVAGNPCISLRDKGFSAFCQALAFVCDRLARAIIADAEGATKFIEINILGADNDSLARDIGLSLANSNLFKTAVYGGNPNWGRIVAAVGSLGISLKQDEVKIKWTSFRCRSIRVDISLSRGRGKARIYTSDLTPEYIKINAEYS